MKRNIVIGVLGLVCVTAIAVVGFTVKGEKQL